MTAGSLSSSWEPPPCSRGQECIQFSFDIFNIRTKFVVRVSFYSVFLQGAFYPDEFIAPSWLGKDIRKGDWKETAVRSERASGRQQL